MAWGAAGRGGAVLSVSSSYSRCTAMASGALLLLLLLLLEGEGVVCGVVQGNGLAVPPSGGASTSHEGGDTLAQRLLAGASQIYPNSALIQRALHDASSRWLCAGDACWRKSVGSVARSQARWDSFDSWLNAFMYTFKRDTIFNLGKIGGIILLYYLAPDLLAWLTNTFG